MTPETASNLMAAEQEMDMMGDLFHRYIFYCSTHLQCRLANTCHTKCISSKYHEEHLTKGESVCTDRCVSKFFDVSYMVGRKLAEHGQQKMQSS